MSVQILDKPVCVYYVYVNSCEKYAVYIIFPYNLLLMDISNPRSLILFNITFLLFTNNLQCKK